MKLNKIIGVTAALLIGVGTVATSHADGEKAKRDQRSGRSDQDADRHRDHRKQVGQGRSDRAGGEREHGDNKRQVSRRGMQGGPPAHIREMMQKRMGGAKGGGRGSQGGPPAGMREMMQKRMGGARSGGRGQGGPKARGGSRGGSCEKCGAKKRGGDQRKRGGDKRRGGRKDRRGNRGHR